MTAISVLCADPERTARDELSERLRTEFTELQPRVTECGSVADADRVIRDDHVDWLITEYEFPDGNGLDLAARLREEYPDSSVILFTAHPHDDIDTDDHDDVVVEFIDKTADDALIRLTSLIELTGTPRSQVSYPLPDEEQLRLAALEEYDFNSETLSRSLDRVTDLITQHFGVEAASVNVIEEHEQRLVACRGIRPEAQTTSREDSICTFTILSDDRVMTVEDIRKDARFESRHEELETLGVRSYMGAQLVTPAEFSIGTLCVYDDDPREFSQADRTYLRTLAELVIDLLTAHARLDGDTEAADDISAAGETFR